MKHQRKKSKDNNKLRENISNFTSNKELIKAKKKKKRLAKSKILSTHFIEMRKKTGNLKIALGNGKGTESYDNEFRNF